MKILSRIGILAFIPLLAPGLAYGQVTYNSTDTFDVDPPLSATQAPGVWFPDRYPPAEFDSFVLTPGENVLRIGIDATADGSASRPPGQGVGFYNTQGRKLDLPVATFALKGSLYVPSSWLGAADRRRSDIWATAIDGSAGITAYPIIGMANVDGTPVIRYYDSLGTADWVNTSVPVIGDTWYEFEMELVGANLVYRVNGTEVGTVSAGGAIQFRDVIFQAYNFNDPALPAINQSTASYEAYWDNFGVARSVINNVTMATFHDTIQEAVDAANPNDVITIEGNINLTSPITVNKALTLDGINKSTTLISGSNDLAGYFMLFSGAADGSLVKNISFDKTDKAGAQNMIGLQRPNLTFQNCDFTGQYVLGDPDVSRAFEMSAGANDFLIDSCSFVGLRQPGYINAVTSGIVQNSYAAGTRGWVVDGGLVTFTGNTWGAGADANAVDIALLAGTPYDPLYDPLSALISNNGGATISDQRTGFSVVNSTTDSYYTTIQSAIDAASNGDALEVYPGSFSETVNINKDVTIQGPNAGVDAVTGVRGPEAVITGAVTVASDGVTLDGLSFTNPTGIYAIYANNFGDLSITNNVISGVNTAGSGSAQGIYVKATMPVAVSGFMITNNKITGIGSATASSSVKGIYFGDSTGPDVISNIVIDGNEICDVEVGNSGAYGILLNHGVNGTGSVSGLQITNNTICDLTGKWVHAIGLETETGAATVTDNEISDLVLNANATPGSVDAVGVFFEKNPVGGPLTDVSKNIFRNSMALGVAVHPDDSYMVDASENFWDAANGPTGVFGSPAMGSGTPVPGGVSHSPWYAEEELINLVTDANFMDILILKGDTETYGDLYIGAGATVTVEGTLIVTGALTLADGGILIVNDGNLDLGDGSVISGSFTVFNSFGSWNINGDTTFSISESLALISEVHVAAGKTLTVNGGGTLILDGCSIDSQTPGSTYNVSVANDGILTMARCLVTDAVIDIETLASTGQSKIYDSSFTTSDIEASADNAVYHNLFDGSTNSDSNTDLTAAFAAVDSWGNVTDPNNFENLFTLDLDISALANRTVDGNSTVFVQPTDVVLAKLNLTALQEKIAGVETLLGYSTNYFTTPEITLVPADWQAVVGNVADNSGTVGTIDAAIGIGFAAADPEGSSADQVLGTVVLTGQGIEGETQFFHRVKLSTDTFGGETRLAVGGPTPSYLAPFTANTGAIVLDGTVPVIDAGSSDGTQSQASAVPNPVDVLDPDPATAPAFTFRNGNVVTLTFTATDAGGSGLDTTDLGNDLVLSATNGSDTLSSYTAMAVESAGVVTYTVELVVPASTSNGTYDVTATVADRSGNVSALTDLGELVIDNEVSVDIELEAFVGGTRVVTFVATDAGGGFLQDWVIPVVFTGDTGSVTLEMVPAATAGISAKTDWNLRSKVPVTFSLAGVASADLTAGNKLPGGDLNGDNLINLLDYSILRFYWSSTVDNTADIDGSGVVILPDYELLRANFFTLGDAE